MTASRPLWAGRATALVGIILIALNLRTAVAALSPIVPQVREDIPLDSLALGVIGMMPPIAFAVSGIVAPWVARRIGLESALVIACVAMIAGPLLRALSGSYPVLLGGTVLALAGMGVGNILLPPAVKKYFPDRIGQVTALYGTLLAIGTALPAITAAPVAGAAGWRVSVAVWAVFALSAMVPWIMVRFQRARDARAAREAGIVPEVPPDMFGKIGHSRVAWAIAVAFIVSSLNAYAMFAWLPLLLVETAGVTDIEAGALLALFGIMGLPAALVIPLVATRMRNVGLLVYLGVAFFVLGYLGLLLIPATATWLWVALIGSGPVIYPLCLMLINLRTRSQQASVALSGFVQAIGYSGGAIGPLVVAVIHDTVGGWQAPLYFLMATCLLGIFSATVLARPRFVEDDLERRAS